MQNDFVDKFVINYDFHLRFRQNVLYFYLSNFYQKIAII